jgi:tetratricopeptide (TPR) repeat protein
MNELLNRGERKDDAASSHDVSDILERNDLVDQLPDTPEACIQAAGGLAQQGKLQEANTWLAATVERFPDSDMAAVHYAWAANRLLDWNAALARWEEMLERFPNHWAGMSGRGEALRELGRLDDAEAALAQAILHHPEDFMPRAQLAHVSVRRQDWDQALERWRAFQIRYPEMEYGEVGIAEALMGLGRLDEAQTALASAERRFPDSARARGLRSAITKLLRRPLSPVDRVRARIREEKIEAVLPTYVENPAVLIEITSICNFACTYCVSPMKLREKKQMSMDTFRQVMEQVATITTKPVCLHLDGEPTSHPQFKEMALVVNAHGLPVSLATNGSHMNPSFLDIWMDPLISMSTSAEELAKRHSKLNFDGYVSRIAKYANAWARSDSRQNIFFQIVHYPQDTPAAEGAYKRAKNDFLVDFSRRAGLYDLCVEETLVTEDIYRLRRKGNPGILTFIKQGLTIGGLYPEDSKFVERERATAGFCDSPWRLLVVHSNGTLGACCSDLSGGTTFASAEEVESKSIKELWESSPRIQRLRQSFLEGTVELDVCQRCLVQEQVAFQRNQPTE